MAKKDETEIQEPDVQREILAEVNVGGHWAYLFGVLLGGAALMLALMAVISGGA